MPYFIVPFYSGSCQCTSPCVLYVEIDDDALPGCGKQGYSISMLCYAIGTLLDYYPSLRSLRAILEHNLNEPQLSIPKTTDLEDLFLLCLSVKCSRSCWTLWGLNMKEGIV